MTFMLNDPLIREDEAIPKDAKLEFRVVLSYDDVEVSEYLEDGETEITLRELLERMRGTTGSFSGDDQYEFMRREHAGDHVVLDTSWYAAVDVQGELDRARFEWGWEKEKREHAERSPLPVQIPTILNRYRKPWVKEGSRG